MTGLDWLPAAIRQPHGGVLPWTTTTNPKGVLHTTEGPGWPDYQGWTILPHATVMPTAGVGVTVRQHLPFSQAAFALMNLSGGVETNRAYAMQFELIGTCDPNGPAGAYFWPAADDAVLLDLYRKVIGPLDAGRGIPFRAAPFLAYPASYGASPVRMSGAEWTAFTGWCGHEHVPENDHGDPGAFPWARLAALVTGPVVDPATTLTGEDMDLYQAPSGIYDIGAGGKRHIGDPAQVKAYASAHPERFDSAGHLTSTITDAALAGIPDAFGTSDIQAVARAVVALLPTGLDAATVAKDVVALLPPPSQSDLPTVTAAVKAVLDGTHLTTT